MNVHEEESARNIENKKKNYMFSLHNDILIHLFSYLDSASLLRFQDSCHTVRKWVNDDSIWVDRWLWGNERVLLSIAKMACINIPVQNTKRFEKDSLTNTKRTRDSFVLLRNVDVEIVQLLLEISFSRRNLRDLTDLLKGSHNLNNDNSNIDSNNNININRNSNMSNTINNTTSDDRYLNVLHLLSVISDTNNSLYSEEFRKTFLNTITDNMNISTYFSDLKSLSPQQQKSRNNNKITDLFLGHVSTLTNEIYYKSVQNSLLNCVGKAFLFLRGEIQKGKWGEVLHQLNSSDDDNNDDNDDDDNDNNNDDNNINEDHNDESMNIKTFFPVEEGFMVISDLKNIENGSFCDRLYISEKIDRMVSLIWRKLGVEASIDNRNNDSNDASVDKENKRELVDRIDRTMVMKALISVMSAPYPTEANIDNDNYTNNYGTSDDREATAVS
jgi:hypothetical protein